MFFLMHNKCLPNLQFISFYHITTKGVPVRQVISLDVE
jgi:hypothetical protein